MDSRRIEAFAVKAVEDCILNAGNFNPVFNKNDTLPGKMICNNLLFEDE